jgi:general secretion pathway protein L
MDILTLRPLGESRWAWVLQNASGIQSGESPLADRPHFAAGTRVRLLLPGDWVTHAAVVISAKSPRLVAQALPFALEESLAEDVEQVRIAHGARAADGTVQARVVNRARLDGVLAELAAQNVHPDAIFSELDAIPRPHEGWVLLPLPDALLMRSAEEAMSVDAAWLSDVLAAGTTVHLIDVPSAAAVVAELPAGCALTREPAPQGAWVWLHQHLREADSIDFLAGQGRGKAWGESLRPWAIPVALAASIVLAQLGLMLVQTQQAKQHTQAMQAEIERVAREAAPEVKRWVNPLSQLRQMAKRGGGATTATGELLPLLALLSPAMDAQPAVKLGNVRYQAGTQPGAKAGKSGANSSGMLDVQLTAPDAAALDAVQSAFKLQRDVQAELSGLRAEGGQAEARLRLKEIGG